MTPNYTEMILNPLLSGLQDSTQELFSMMGSMIPIMFPIVGGLALIFLIVNIFKGIVNESILEHEYASNYAENMDFVDSYLGYDLEDMQSDYFMFDDGFVNYDDESYISNEWIDVGIDDE